MYRQLIIAVSALKTVNDRKYCLQQYEIETAVVLKAYHGVENLVIMSRLQFKRIVDGKIRQGEQN